MRVGHAQRTVRTRAREDGIEETSRLHEGVWQAARMATAKQQVQAFHTWHSSRTFNPGNPQIDPWMRDVLVNLQVCLNSLADQIDDNTERLDRIEQHLRRKG